MNGRNQVALYFCLAAMLLLLIPGQAARGQQAWSLREAVDYALAHNPDLAVARAQLYELEEGQAEVRANFMPDINLQGGYTYIHNVPEIELDMSVQTPIPGLDPIQVHRSIDMGYHDNYLLQLNFNQLLFASGQVYYAHRAVGRQLEAGNRQLDAARLVVARHTAEAYLSVLIAQSVTDAQREALRVAAEHLRHVTNRYEAGAATRFDFLRAQVEVDNIKPQVSEAEKNVKLARTMLRRVMGLPGDEPLQLSGRLETQVELVDETQILAQAQQNRPELAALAEARRAAEDQALSSRGAMLPAVVFTGTYSYQKPYFMTDDWEANWTAGIGVQIPLFDGLQSYHRMQRARANAETQSRTGDRVRADIRTEVESAALAMSEAAVRIKATSENLQRAQQVVEIAENAYTAGAATSLEVIDAQLAATAARVAHLKAQYDYLVARVRLAAARGDLAAIGE